MLHRNMWKNKNHPMYEGSLGVRLRTFNVGRRKKTMAMQIISTCIIYVHYTAAEYIRYVLCFEVTVAKGRDVYMYMEIEREEIKRNNVNIITAATVDDFYNGKFLFPLLLFFSTCPATSVVIINAKSFRLLTNLPSLCSSA